MGAAPSAVERIGLLVAQARLEEIPARAVERAKVSLLHNLAVAGAGRALEGVAHRMARTIWPLPAQATLLHDGTRASPEGAAFANAALINIRSQDDTQAATTSHPGAPVMAAALAVAEMEGASGAEFLAAVILGYEALGRIGRDVDHLLTARGWRPAAVLGVFGAAAAAARLLRLDATATAHALALAAQMPAGTAQVWVEGSADFALQLGAAARNGVQAARAAALGATGGRFALEGASGFWRAYAGTTDIGTEGFDAPAATWQVEEATVKPHPVCAILQGPVERLLELRRRHALRPEAVAGIELALSPYEAAYPGIDHAGPFASATATKMSAQFCLGLALLEGRITPAGLARVADPAVLAPARLVTLRAEPAMPERLSALAIRLADGRILSARVEQPLGQPSFAEMTAMAGALAAEAGQDAAALARAVAALEEAPDLSALLRAALPVDAPGMP